MEILTNNHKYDTLDPDAGSTANSFRVTDIRPSVHHENRVNIYLDSKFSFSLDLSQVVDNKIRVGRRLDSREVEELKRASAFGLLYQRTLEWVLTRPRSIKETRDYLRIRKSRRHLDNIRRAKNAELTPIERRERHLPSRPLPEILDEDIEAVIARLIERGYLDDEKFARYFLENRNQTKGTSLLRLRQELTQKGVSSNIIENALADAPRNDREEIEKIIAKKRAKYDDNHLKMYLLRRGFSYDLIQDVLK